MKEITRKKVLDIIYYGAIIIFLVFLFHLSLTFFFITAILFIATDDKARKKLGIKD